MFHQTIDVRNKPVGVQNRTKGTDSTYDTNQAGVSRPQTTASVSLLEKQLRQTGLRVTPLRIALLSYLHAQDVPVDVQSCVQGMQNQGVSFDQVTIYRNLEHFQQKGLVKKVDVRDGKYYYEIDDVCSHLICEQCGSVSHIHLDTVDSVIQKAVDLVSQKTTFTVRVFATDFFGTCESCLKK